MVSKKIIQFEIFKQFPDVFHGISTREFGNIKQRGIVNGENLRKFTSVLSINPDRTVFTRQVHGSDIAYVNTVPAGVIDARDGLLTDKQAIFIGVSSADCLPIIFYEPVKKIIGVVHAGWKGVLASIIENMILRLKELGADIKRVSVGIGPGIGVCCYNVTKERADIFREKFPHKKDIIQTKGRSIYLDLKLSAKEILLNMGIGNENIEVLDYCTVDNNDLFFSYRKDSEKSFGGFVTLIGMR